MLACATHWSKFLLAEVCVTLTDVVGFTLSTASDPQGQHWLALEHIPGEKSKQVTGARDRARGYPISTATYL